MKTEETDDCAYLIKLYKNALCQNTLKTKDQFFERIFNLQGHVEFSRLKVAKLKDVPYDIRKTYKTLVKLYNRFSNE